MGFLRQQEKASTATRAHRRRQGADDLSGGGWAGLRFARRCRGGSDGPGRRAGGGRPHRSRRHARRRPGRHLRLRLRVNGRRSGTAAPRSGPRPGASGRSDRAACAGPAVASPAATASCATPEASPGSTCPAPSVTAAYRKQQARADRRRLPRRPQAIPRIPPRRGAASAGSTSPAPREPSPPRSTTGAASSARTPTSATRPRSGPPSTASCSTSAAGSATIDVRGRDRDPAGSDQQPRPDRRRVRRPGRQVARLPAERDGSVTTIDPPGAGATVVTDVDDQGRVVGASVDEKQTAISAFVRDPDGRFTTIAHPDAGFYGTEPEGINNEGQIAGSYSDANDRIHGFVLDDGAYTTVDAPDAPGNTQVLDIDDRGRLVGVSGLRQLWLPRRRARAADRDRRSRRRERHLPVGHQQPGRDRRLLRPRAAPGATTASCATGAAGSGGSTFPAPWGPPPPASTIAATSSATTATPTRTPVRPPTAAASCSTGAGRFDADRRPRRHADPGGRHQQPRRDRRRLHRRRRRAARLPARPRRRVHHDRRPRRPWSRSCSTSTTAARRPASTSTPAASSAASGATAPARSRRSTPPGRSRPGSAASTTAARSPSTPSTRS